VNSAFERSEFRGIAQLPNESVDQYITRLRQKALNCNFHNIEENIRDQLIEKCYSQRLRRKLLEKDDPSLDECRQIAIALEASESQAIAMEQTTSTNHEHVNKVSTKFSRMHVNHGFKTKVLCFACGHEGHIKSDPQCPAKRKTCRKCKKVGHLERCCKSKSMGKAKYWKSKSKNKVLQVNCDEEQNDSEDSDYVFTVSELSCKNEYTCKYWRHYGTCDCRLWSFCKSN
jgi:hypothetical protein